MRILVAVPALLLLSGCGTSGGDGSSKVENGTAAIAASEAPAPAKLRPGLWKTRVLTASAGVDTEPEEHCVDAATDIIDNFGGKNEGECSKRELRREGGHYVIDVQCSSKELNSSIKGTLGGDFTTVVTADLTIGLGLPGGGTDISRVTYESRYAGSCTPDRG